MHRHAPPCITPLCTHPAAGVPIKDRILQALLAMMRHEGVPRQGACYLQLVEALAGCNRHADAIEIVELMRAQKLPPSQAAAMACLQTVQGAQSYEGAAVGEPARRLVQLLREEAAVHGNEPHRPEPSQPPFGAMRCVHR